MIVNSALDRPWSQYCCCVLAGNREFVSKHPVATKRVLRAIFKATDFCVTDRSARPRWSIGGLPLRPRPADDEGDPLHTSGATMIPKIRSASMRFGCAKRDMINSTPNKLIAEGTDWRFFNELKRELKG